MESVPREKTVKSLGFIYRTWSLAERTGNQKCLRGEGRHVWKRVEEKYNSGAKVLRVNEETKISKTSRGFTKWTDLR